MRFICFALSSERTARSYVAHLYYTSMFSVNLLGFVCLVMRGHGLQLPCRRLLCLSSSSSGGGGSALVGCGPAATSLKDKGRRLELSAKIMVKRLEVAATQEERYSAMSSRMGLMSNRNFWKPLIQMLQKKGKNELLCVEVFDWMRSELPNIGKPQIYANMIAFAGVIGRPQLAHAWLADMKNKEIEVSTVTYNALISVLCRNGEVGKAVDMLESMKTSANCQPNTSTYNTVIAAYGKAANVANMEKWLEECKRGGLSPDIVTYNTLLFTYFNRGRLDKVEETYNTMLAAGCKLDAVSYSILLHGYKKANMVGKMESAFADRQKSGLPITAIAAQQMVEVYAKNGMFDRVGDITLMLVEAAPTVFTTPLNSAILGCYVKAGDVKQLEAHLWRIVSRKKAFVSPEVLEAAVAVFCANGAVDRFGTLYECFKAVPRWRLNVSTYELLIREYARRGLYDKVVQVSTDMELVGWKWSMDTMQVLYEVFKKAGDEVRLVLILEKMKSIGDEDDQVQVPPPRGHNVASRTSKSE